jgi:mannose-6-phosphate isomerase-like protein (cupin superfamily)
LSSDQTTDPRRETAQARIDRDTDEMFVSLRRPLGISAFGLNQIRLAPGQRLRIHRHRDQEEVYLVLEGRLTVTVERKPVELCTGELLRVGAQVRRQLANYGPDPVLLVALGGSGEHTGRDAEAFASWDEETPGEPRDIPLPPDLTPEERARPR